MIIPCFNGERFIRRALDSVRAQTLRPAEVFVVDDGSTDGTLAILAAEYPEARVISQANGGVSKARNAGVRAATSRYVAFLDADDWWASRKIEVQVASMRANPDATANYTGISQVSAGTGEESTEHHVDVRTLWPRLRWCSPGIPPSSVMMTREALTRLGGFTEGLRVCEDWELWFKVVRGGRFVVSPEPLTYYRLSTGGLSGNADVMFRSFLEILDRLLLDELTGWKRGVWRRRIVSYQAYKSALTARGAGDRATERRYMGLSLRTWPSPFWIGDRGRAALVTYLRR